MYRAPRKAASAGGQRLGVCGLLVCVGAVFGSAQTELRITHGVASGEVTETSAIVWARSNREAQMEVRYQPVVGTREAQLASSRSSSATNLSAQVRLEGLEPETQYRYEVWFDDGVGRSTVEAGAFRTAPRGEARVAVSFVWSGDLGGQGYCRHTDGGYRIFRHMAALRPDFFVANGDMIYADSVCPSDGPLDDWDNVPGDFLGIRDQAVDWTDRDQIEDVYASHWLYNRADLSYQAFLSMTPMYVQWDDHEVINDFGGPWSAYSPTPFRDGYPNLVASGRKTLFDFHPFERHPEEPDRIYRSFRWGHDVELFILDARSYRSENRLEDLPGAEKTMLGREQLNWLKTGLSESSATWKIVSTDVPLSAPTGANAEQYGRDAWANGRGQSFSASTGFETELIELLQSVDENDVRNVVFLTTDVHFAAQLRYDVDLNEDGDRLVFHELIGGPLSAIRSPAPPAFDPTLRPVVLYGEGDLFNFGTVRVGDGSPGAPHLWSDIRDDTGRIRPGSALELEPEP